MGDDFKAIVIAGRSNNWGANDPAVRHNSRAYVFETFSDVLTFIRSTKAVTLIIEFSVETDTLDFYDEVKKLGVPVVFSANSLGPSQFPKFGIRASDVVYPNRCRLSESFADYRPLPGIQGTSSATRAMAPGAQLDA